MTEEEIKKATEKAFRKHWDDSPKAYLIEDGKLVDIKKTKEFEDEMKKFFTVEPKLYIPPIKF